MRRLFLMSLLMLGVASPTLADPPMGCFTRDYSAGHLAKNPNQHVASIRLLFDRGDGAMYPRFLYLDGRFADQGRARLDGVGGAAFSQSAFCVEDGGTFRCQVECDGGGLEIAALKGDTLTVSTDYFTLESGGGCEAVSDLAELGGGKTIYRLTRAPIAACAGLAP